MKLPSTPWTYDGRIINAADGNPIWSLDRSPAERRAIAELIAAAPELLDALKAAEKLLGILAPQGTGYGVDRDVIEQIAAAIAKAEGKS